MNTSGNSNLAMPDRLIKVWSWTDSLALAVVAFFGASFAGLATQLRSGKIPDRWSICSAMLNSGLMGAIIALLGQKTFSEDPPYLLGMALLAGMGGASLLDFFFALVKRRMGITIRVERYDEKKGD